MTEPVVDWVESFHEPHIWYGTRRDGESPDDAFKDLIATIGDNDLDWETIKPIYMKRVTGQEAEDLFDGEFDSGWVPCSKDQGGQPFWEIETC